MRLINGFMMQKRKGAEIYDYLRILLSIVILIVFIFAVFFYIMRAEASPAAEVEKKAKADFCSTDADCSEGVCTGGECVCFLDSQCKISKKCDMGTGICGK